MIFSKTTSNREIAKILKRCSKGNKKAQEHLYSVYYGYAMSIALRYSKSKTEAEEIINDSFYKIFTKFDLHKADGEFKPWFRRIIINTSIDHYRANVKNNKLIVLDDFPEDPPHNDIIDNIDAEDIIQQLQNLSPNYRLVFNLYIIEGYNHDEIAEKLNITASTSRSNLARAKQKLRELIKDYSYYGKAR